MLVLIRGAGDLASGVALRLYHAGFDVVMTDLARPTAIRRTVAFSQAIALGETTVEGVTARLATAETVPAVLAATDAPVVIALGPGFTAGRDCHAVVETMRGHTLGRVIWDGPALPNTNVPGLIGGFAGERVLRAPADGIFRPVLDIGALVEAGDVAGYVGDAPMVCTIGGVLRGILPPDTPVRKGMKSGDVDPRAQVSHCYTVSDKALAIGGGVLEAILQKTNLLRN